MQSNNSEQIYSETAESLKISKIQKQVNTRKQ